MFILYLKPGCPYCAESMSLIKKYKLKHKFIEVNSENKREQLKKKHKMETFPQIFYLKNKKRSLIGGNDQLKQKIILCKKIAKSIINNNIQMDLEIVNSLKSHKKIKTFINKCQ